MIRIAMIVALTLLAAFAQASPLPPAARTEIAALLNVLAQSDCEFYRNGNWYAGAKAASHLQRKFDYLNKRDLISSAEAFIALGASKSSMSKEIYQVRCPHEPAVPSALWLNELLDELRGEPRNPGENLD